MEGVSRAWLCKCGLAILRAPEAASGPPSCQKCRRACWRCVVGHRLRAKPPPLPLRPGNEINLNNRRTFCRRRRRRRRTQQLVCPFPLDAVTRTSRARLVCRRAGADESYVRRLCMHAFSSRWLGCSPVMDAVTGGYSRGLRTPPSLHDFTSRRCHTAAEAQRCFVVWTRTCVSNIARWAVARRRWLNCDIEDFSIHV